MSSTARALTAAKLYAERVNPQWVRLFPYRIHGVVHALTMTTGKATRSAFVAAVFRRSSNYVYDNGDVNRGVSLTRIVCAFSAL